MKKTNVNARIISRLLLLQQFDLTIVEKIRKENVVANLRLRLTLYTDVE